MGGTCTGAHASGRAGRNISSEALHAMRALKAALHLHNIFNPGKIVVAA
jgi:FAD/FMN-containing dehydrogenase